MCPSFDLDLKFLIRKAQKALEISLAVAAAVHLSFTQWGGGAEQQRTAKPLTTQFVKRQPRLTKPLELKKRPRPKRRKIHRKMVSVKARVSRQEVRSTFGIERVLGTLSKPRAQVERSVGMEHVSLEPGVLAEMVESDKDAQNVVDMSLEMVDIDALDTGRYHAMVIQDPKDKRNIKGFFHLAIAYSVNAAHSSLGAHYYENPMALPNLVAAINRYTDIETDIADAFPFASSQLFLTPWVYCPVSSYAGKPFALTYEEARNLGKYMLTGGFFFADDSNPRLGDNPDRVARAMIRDAFRGVDMEQGNDWNFEKLPNHHPIYHCYFEFPNGPPPGLDTPGLRGFAHGPYHYIEGIIISDRLVALMSNKAFDEAWSLHQGNAGWSKTYDNTRALQFGINSVVFALTQEGSITYRVMHAVR